jgi:hypothetical protein
MLHTLSAVRFLQCGAQVGEAVVEQVLVGANLHLDGSLQLGTHALDAVLNLHEHGWRTVCTAKKGWKTNRKLSGKSIIQKQTQQTRDWKINI